MTGVLVEEEVAVVGEGEGKALIICGQLLSLPGNMTSSKNFSKKMRMTSIVLPLGLSVIVDEVAAEEETVEGDVVEGADDELGAGREDNLIEQPNR